LSSPQLVGRVPQLAGLVDALTGVGVTGSGVALVAGEPGVGKTRLVTEFAQLATAAGGPRSSGPTRPRCSGTARSARSRWTGT
jgi:hypothetical protein